MAKKKEDKPRSFTALEWNKKVEQGGSLDDIPTISGVHIHQDRSKMTIEFHNRDKGKDETSVLPPQLARAIEELIENRERARRRKVREAFDTLMEENPMMRMMMMPTPPFFGPFGY